jgi:hypothetical protein
MDHKHCYKKIMGKIKLLLISVCFTISPQLVNSQFFVELNTGYAAPLYYTGKDTVYNQDYIHKYRYADTIFTECGKYNMGNGFSLGSSMGYLTKIGLKFDLDIFYLNNKDINFLYNNYRHEWNMAYGWNFGDSIPKYYNKYEQYIAYYSSRFSLIPKIGYVHDFKDFSLEYYIGSCFSDITVYVYYNGYDESVTNTTGVVHGTFGEQIYHYYQLEESVSKFKYNKKLITPYFQLKCNYKFNPNLSLNMAASVSPFMSFNKDKGLYYYYGRKSVYDDREFLQEQELEMIDIVPQGIKPNRYNLNVINFSLGIRY